MYCNKCGTQNADGGVFCSKCGAAINATAVDTRLSVDSHMKPWVNAKQPPKKSNHIKRNLIIACLAFLLIAGGAVAAGMVWTRMDMDEHRHTPR